MADNLVGKSRKNFKFLKQIGYGTYGTVYQGLNKEKNQKVAIKAILRDKINSQHLQILVKNEISMLEDFVPLNNQNIIKIIDKFITQKNLYIILEYCEDGDLQEYLIKKRRLSEQEATEIIKQVLNGFCAIHQVKGMHRDIKLANILKKGQIIKIADFGLSKRFKDNQTVTKSDLGTPLTKAPQLFKNQEYDQKADIWSIGIIYYQMIYGKYPFEARNPKDFLRLIMQNKIDFCSGVKISKQAKDFIERCLTIDPKQRISWVEIYQHPLIINENPLHRSSVSNLKLSSNKSYYEKLKSKKSMIEQNQSILSDIFTLKDIDGSQGQKIQIKKLQQKLFKKRNDIFFMFTYFIPKYQNLKHFIGADHNNPLFLVSKKVLIQLQRLSKELKQKEQQKQGSVLKIFFKSENFIKFKNSLQGDIKDMKILCFSFMKGKKKYEQVEAQKLDFEKWKKKEWKMMVKGYLRNYKNQISQFIEQKELEIHQKEMLQMIRALQYYEANMSQTDGICVEKFQQILKSMDLQEFKSEIIHKLNQSNN